MKTLDCFDWNHPRSIDRGLYEELLDLDFVERHVNILFRGPSGAGKTTLAKNIGLEALKKAYTVRFATLAAILADLSKQDSLPALERHSTATAGRRSSSSTSSGMSPATSARPIRSTTR